jgi:hypothetical protein
MEPMRERVARCGCGGLTVTARGEPAQVYLCSCLNCQRESGSAFTYQAVFPASALSVAGPSRIWRHHGDSGNWLENELCPTCGVSVLFRLQIAPGLAGVAVGCFADPQFAAPQILYWASRRHGWLSLPPGVEQHATQPD